MKSIMIASMFRLEVTINIDCDTSSIDIVLVYNNDQWITNISFHFPGSSGPLWPHIRSTFTFLGKTRKNVLHFGPETSHPTNIFSHLTEYGGLDARGLDGLGHGNILRSS